MTQEEFVDYYETTHSKFVGHFKGVVKYFRRYPAQDDSGGQSAQNTCDCDVIMELWFDSKESFLASHDHDNEADAAFWQAALEDEKKLFDYGAEGWQRMLVIDVEHETDLSSPHFTSTYE